MSKRELGDFLRRRREALRPDQLPGSTTHPRGHRARRTPGLRREEVAEIAGVSISYYERLEQARGARPSAQVLAALGAALQLTTPELEHLARLAGLAPVGRSVGPVPHRSPRPDAIPDVGGQPDGTPVPADALRLVERLGSVPAYLVDERQDIVAWNASAASLIIDFARLPVAERNVARLSIRLGGTHCFEPADTNGEFARQFAAELRAATGRHPTDHVLSELVNEFAAHSPDFVASWRDHDVRPRPVVRKHLRHPDLGELELDCHTLLLPGTDVRLVIHTASPGSPSAAALARLDPSVADAPITTPPAGSRSTWPVSRAARSAVSPRAATGSCRS